MDTSTVPTPREQWLAARRRTTGGWLIGASEAAAVLGWSRFDDRFSLWHRKRGLVPPDADDELDDRRDAGTFLEAGILRWYSKRTGRRVLSPHAVGSALREVEHGRRIGTFTDPDLRELLGELSVTYRVHYGPDDDGRLVLVSQTFPWLAVSPDAFVLHAHHGWGFVDAKNIDFDRAWDRGAKVPPEYASQIAHATMPTELRWGGFAVCVSGQRLVVVDVLREDMREIEELLGEEGPAFVRALDCEIPPPPTGSDASMETLRRRWPEHEPTKAVGWVSAVEACGKPWQPDEWDAAHANAVEQRLAWTKEVRDLEIVLRHVAKDAGIVVLPGNVRYTITREGDRERIRRRGGSR